MLNLVSQLSKPQQRPQGAAKVGRLGSVTHIRNVLYSYRSSFCVDDVYLMRTAVGKSAILWGRMSFMSSSVEGERSIAVQHLQNLGWLPSEMGTWKADKKVGPEWTWTRDNATLQVSFPLSYPEQLGAMVTNLAWPVERGVAIERVVKTVTEEPGKKLASWDMGRGQLLDIEPEFNLPNLATLTETDRVFVKFIVGQLGVISQLGLASQVTIARAPGSHDTRRVTEINPITFERSVKIASESPGQQKLTAKHPAGAWNGSGFDQTLVWEASPAGRSIVRGGVKVAGEEEQSWLGVVAGMTAELVGISLLPGAWVQPWVTNITGRVRQILSQG